MNKEAAMEYHQATPAAQNTGATVIDLSANPDNFSPAIGHIVTSIQNARAANQKVIVMVGERHDTISHVALSSLLRYGLKAVGNEDKPALALENNHNLSEFFVSKAYKKQSPSAYHRIYRILQDMKKDSPEDYRHIHALNYAGAKWLQTPVTKLESVSSWLREESPVHMIDLALIRSNKPGKIDMKDPDTAELVKSHRKPINFLLNEKFHKGSMRLRNQWMMANLQTISNDNDITFLQTGLAHLGGDSARNVAYEYSLHNLAQDIRHNAKIITVMPEDQKFTFARLPKQAKKAMDTPNTVIIRGGNDTRHLRKLCSSVNEEIATLSKIFSASGLPDNTLSVQNEDDYETQRQRLKPINFYI